MTKKLAYQPTKTQLALENNMAICQADYPLDWYQEEFIPYAEEYLALPDRQLKTIYHWMLPYVNQAKAHFGDQLLLLAHYYMGGEIVKLVEAFGGSIGDSYQLALMAVNHPNKSVIVESAVHFMAESIRILAHDHQAVYITNPKSGCTMEMLAKDFMVEPAFLDLNERYGTESILPICYMNTSGRVKAMAGAQGGVVCTSSNAKKIVAWGLNQGKKILFIPDKHLGENIASWLDIKNIAYWPGGSEGALFNLNQQSPSILSQFDQADLILFSSFCAVHTYFKPEMVEFWQNQEYTTIVHPECPNTIVKLADFYGSTAFIWDHVMQDRSNTQRYAIATENHMVENLKEQAKLKGITVVNLADAVLPSMKSMGCGCATMSRNDPPHLVALLDLLQQGKKLPYNAVEVGDNIHEFSGRRERLDKTSQQWITDNAKLALKRMIDITQS